MTFIFAANSAKMAQIQGGKSRAVAILTPPNHPSGATQQPWRLRRIASHHAGIYP
ncbi:hypothetical protein ART_1558 [Arthrobacter sp. PAMC 25486]|nr:hypothetical protein ART_1558 [Arthrobacter sp. PAMC 25486]